MKIPTLKKQIIRNFAIAGVFAIIFGCAFYYYSNQKNTVRNKIDAIESETAQINVELADLQSKTAEIKKYKDLWSTISENKKSTTGVKVDEITARLNSIATKYGITSPTLKISLPDPMKGGVFERKTVTVMMMTASINFVTANDLKAIMFVNEFISSLKGYPVVTAFSVNKSKDYTNDELVELSTGKSQGLVNNKVDFYWYIYKDLEKKPYSGLAKQINDEAKTPELEVPDAQKQTP